MSQCLEPSCHAFATNGDFCNPHFRAYKPRPRCAAEGCEKPAYRRTWCTKHYARWRKHGDINIVLPHPNALPQRDPAEMERIRAAVEEAARPLTWMALMYLVANPDSEWESA